MHFFIALLYIIFIIKAYIALTAIKSINFIQDAESIKKRFKIELNLYFERDCDENLRVMNDLIILAK